MGTYVDVRGLVADESEDAQQFYQWMCDCEKCNLGTDTDEELVCDCYFDEIDSAYDERDEW